MPYLFLYSTAKNRNNNIFFSLRKKIKDWFYSLFTNLHFSQQCSKYSFIFRKNFLHFVQKYLNTIVVCGISLPS